MKKIFWLSFFAFIIYSCNNEDNSQQIIGRWTRRIAPGVIDTTEYLPNGKFNETLYIITNMDTTKRTIHSHHGFWKQRDHLLIRYQYFNHVTVGNDTQKFNIKVIRDLNSKADTASSQIDSSFSSFIIKGGHLILLEKLSPNASKLDSVVWKKI